VRPDSEQRRLARWKKRDERELIDGHLVAVNARTHGNDSTYTNWMCRCIPCTEAHRIDQINDRERRRQSRVLIDGRWTAVGLAKHGESGYSNWSCRCRVCSEKFHKSMAYDLERRQIRRANQDT
jgi:hypothetical protein